MEEVKIKSSMTTGVDDDFVPLEEFKLSDLEVKKTQPVIVVGTGRCGSSAMAKALFMLDVHMGDTFPLPTNNHQSGYFEDVDIGTLCERRIKGLISKEIWTERMKAIIADRQKYQFWGWKNPITQHLLSDILELTGGAKFIWVRRDKSETIKSMKKHWIMSGWKAKRRFERDDNQLKEMFRSEGMTVLELLFSKHPNRTQIVEDLIKFTGIKPTRDQALRAVESILLPPAPVIRTTKAELWKYE